MEYKTIWLGVIGLIVGFLWLIDFSKIFWPRVQALAFQNQRHQKWRIWLKLVLLCVGLLGWMFLSYGLLQPRTAQEFAPSSREVNDIFLVVDVSRSMLADDLPPNRLEVAKRKLREFAEMRSQDRVGLIIFSEKIFTLMPLSVDPDLLLKLIGDIGIGYLGSGTNIGDALGLAVARMVDSETKNKVIVLLTDGVANVGNLTPLQAAEEAKKHGLKVYTIGLGSDSDAKIPTGRGLFGPQFQLIPGGSIDYKVLQEISEMTGGKFYPAKDEKGLEKVFKDINHLERTEIKINNQIVYKEHYYFWYVLGIALILLAEILRRTVMREAA